MIVIFVRELFEIFFDGIVLENGYWVDFFSFLVFDVVVDVYDWVWVLFCFG